MIIDIIAIIGLVLCIFLIVECWSLKMDLENEESLHEFKDELLHQYINDYLESYDDARQWEKKYNELLKGFQRYIDEYGNKQHQCNCCKKEVDES